MDRSNGFYSIGTLYLGGVFLFAIVLVPYDTLGFVLTLKVRDNVVDIR